MKDSLLIEEIIKTIGEIPAGLFFFFPPILLMAPFFFFFWAGSMTQRISPIVCAKLCEAASDEERGMLLAVVYARNGRPLAFDLWRLKNRLRALAERREEEQAMSLLKAECNK